MRALPCAGDCFLVNSSTAREQIYEYRPNAKDIYYPAAPHGITAAHQGHVKADMLAFLQS
jgi:hypothetical protein